MKWIAPEGFCPHCHKKMELTSYGKLVEFEVSFYRCECGLECPWWKPSPSGAKELAEGDFIRQAQQEEVDRA